jgi:hypothetical protein
MPSLTKSRKRAMFSRRVDTGIPAPMTPAPYRAISTSWALDRALAGHCLVPEAVIDEVALAAAFPAFPPN